MPISIDGTGTITGLSAGGLPDDCITTAEIAGSAVTTAKVNAASITAAKLDGAQAGSAPIYGARAWVNFDGTRNETGGSDTATTNRFIRASGNVSSVLRNGVGDYTVNFTVAMQDVNYAATGITGIESGNCFLTPQSATNSTAGFRFTTNDRNISFSQRDQSNINIVIFR